MPYAVDAARARFRRNRPRGSSVRSRVRQHAAPSHLLVARGRHLPPLSSARSASKARHSSIPSSDPSSMSLISARTKSSSASSSRSSYSDSSQNNRANPAAAAACNPPRFWASRNSSARARCAECLPSVVRRQGAEKRQGRHELRELLDRDGNQLREPLVQLASPLVGQPVDGPLRAPAVAHGLLRPDEAAALERLDHRVQRPVVEPHALLLAPRSKRLGHFVGVHGALEEAHQHAERQGVGPGRTRHLVIVFYSE